MRAFVRDYKQWGLGTAVWNLRFTLGMSIGGFTSAKRAY